jgi:hypothetical protein
VKGQIPNGGHQMNLKYVENRIAWIVAVFWVIFLLFPWIGNAVGGPVLTWQNMSSLIAPPKINDVIYSKNADKFFVVGDSGAILWSADGENWSGQIYSDGKEPCLYAVAEADSGALRAPNYSYNLVAVGQYGRVLGSLNGEKWSHIAMTRTNVRSVTWTKNGFLIVGDNGFAAKSRDGNGWDTVSIPTVMNLQSVAAYGDTIAVVGELDSVFLSYDGVSWAAYPLPTESWKTFDKYAIASGNGMLLLTAGAGDFFESLYSSSDGIVWQKNSNFSGLSKPIWDGNRFIVNENGSSNDIAGQIWLSTDGNAWTSAGTSSPLMEMNAIAWKGPEWMGVGRFRVYIAGFYEYFPMIERSKDQKIVEDCIPFRRNRFSILRSDSDTVFAYGNLNTLCISLSPVFSFHSTQRAFPDVYIPDPEIDYKVGNLYVRGHGSILTSTDTTQWDTISSPANSKLYCVAFGAGQYVVVGDSGTILTSRDGTEWTIQNSGTKESLNGIMWAENQFLAVGTNGTILSSDDAGSWNLEKSGSTRRLNSIAWGSGMYLTVGDSGTILSSTDVQVWSSSKAFTTANLNDVVFHNSRFIAAGDNSALLVSDPVAGTIQRESRLNRFFDISMKGNTGTICLILRNEPLYRFLTSAAAWYNQFIWESNRRAFIRLHFL